jgi:hypothetical protein
VAGHNGTFTPKPRRKHIAVTNPHLCGIVEVTEAPPINPRPVSSPALPMSVHINISRAASLDLSDLEVRSSMYIALRSRNSKDINISQRDSTDIKTRPAASVTIKVVFTPPIIVVGRDWVMAKNGRLPIIRAPKTPNSKELSFFKVPKSATPTKVFVKSI